MIEKFRWFTSIFCTKPSIWVSIEFVAVAAIANYYARMPTQFVRLTLLFTTSFAEMSTRFTCVWHVRTQSHIQKHWRRSVTHSMSTQHRNNHVRLFLSSIQFFTRSHLRFADVIFVLNFFYSIFKFFEVITFYISNTYVY